MGKTLVHRMRMRSKRYIALHLRHGRYKIIDAAKCFCYRFEPDMLAFSGCDYGGGEKERNELGAIRKRWKTLHVRLKFHTLSSLMHPDSYFLQAKNLQFGK
ncbi:hypothetical protein Gohar_016949 [Gossypium harknessii]|uniref:O-fucosyltransferase family protein n=1 Tax=Gossypium harknessii TaxID=34285 RepID=A0A7J9G4S0_9ROSI|nr:hypothetical protein [Gossypium harknessii]